MPFGERRRREEKEQRRKRQTDVLGPTREFDP
jgi:hypothetical protein